MRRPVSVRISLNEGDAGVEGIAEALPEYGGTVEDFAGVEAEDAVALDGEEAARRLGDQHGAAIAGEEQDAVLEVAEDLVEVFLESGEDLFNVAHALAEALDFAGDGGGGVLPGRLLASGAAISLGAVSRSSCMLICSMGRRARLLSRKATRSEAASTIPMRVRARLIQGA